MTAVKNILFCLLLNCISIRLSICSNRQQYLIDLISLMQDRTRYDKNLYAPTQNGAPILVNVNVDVQDLRDISEMTMSFRVEIYFTQAWNDRRLIVNENYTNISYTTLNPDYLEYLWLPDTFFSNVLDSTAPPKDADSFTHKNLLQIDGKGNVYYSQRLSLTAACMMKLKNYPFDYQMCRLPLESYGIESKYMVYKWNNLKSFSLSNITLPDFTVANVTTASAFIIFDENATYSRLILCFSLARKTAFYFMELYIPAILIVISAWLATVGNQSSFSDILGVLLAQLFLYFSYITVMPRVSDIKAMDIFLIGCFAFIFVALMQTFISTEETLYENSKQKMGPLPSPRNQQRESSLKRRCDRIHPSLSPKHHKHESSLSPKHQKHGSSLSPSGHKNESSLSLHESSLSPRRNRRPSPSGDYVNYIKVQPFAAESSVDEYSEKKVVLKKRKVVRHKAKKSTKELICKYVTCHNFFLYAMYPTAFTLFCFFYFVTYMHIIKDHYTMEKC